MCVCVCVCIYIYMYTRREGEGGIRYIYIEVCIYNPRLCFHLSATQKVPRAQSNVEIDIKDIDTVICRYIFIYSYRKMDR